MITFVIIPRFGSSDAVVLSSIGSYLSFILVLQMMGTYRGLKSFSEKNKNRKNVEQKYKAQRFEWNIGSLIAIALLIYEVFQFAMFAAHTVQDGAGGGDVD